MPATLTRLRELQLVRAHQEGDPEAIGEIVRAYQHRVYGVCRRMLRSPEDARDLTHEALIKVIEGLDSYDGRSALSTWIIRVTMNCCLSHLRRERVRRHGSLDEPVGAGHVPKVAILEGPGNLEPGARVELDELREMLLVAMERLDPAMRAVIVLRDLQELDYQQIGAVLDVPIGTVKSRLFRAREALRREAEALGGRGIARESAGDDEKPNGPSAK